MINCRKEYVGVSQFDRGHWYNKMAPIYIAILGPNDVIERPNIDLKVIINKIIGLK